jgi:Cilia- and flagella-associated protein 298
MVLLHLRFAPERDEFLLDRPGSTPTAEVVPELLATHNERQRLLYVASALRRRCRPWLDGSSANSTQPEPAQGDASASVSSSSPSADEDSVSNDSIPAPGGAGSESAVDALRRALLDVDAVLSMERVEQRIDTRLEDVRGVFLRLKEAVVDVLEGDDALVSDEQLSTWLSDDPMAIRAAYEGREEAQVDPAMEAAAAGEIPEDKLEHLMRSRMILGGAPLPPEVKRYPEDSLVSYRKGLMDPATACVWWMSKELTRDEKVLSDFVGRNEKTKIAVRMSRSNKAGPPPRENPDPAGERARMAYYFRLQQEHERLEAAELERGNTDADVALAGAPWADPQALRNSAHGEVPFRTK